MTKTRIVNMLHARRNSFGKSETVVGIMHSRTEKVQVTGRIIVFGQPERIFLNE